MTSTSVLSSRHDFADHLDAPGISKPASHSNIPSNEQLDFGRAAELQDGDGHLDSEAQAADYREYHDNGASGDHVNRFNDGDPQNVPLKNGVAPASDFAFDASYTYPSAGLSQSQDDLDLDPAALLESLANFEHPPSNSSTISISNDHFASLLQAAATAGGQEHTLQDHSTIRRSTRRSDLQPDSLSGLQQKRKRVDTSDNAPETQGFLVSHVKRKKTPGHEVDEDVLLAREREIWGSEEQDEDGSHSAFESAPGNHAFHPSGNAGIQSAAALFRKPTNASKKYTRPPMSKMFISLQLSAESFLQMQSAAKAYMLDPEHPERKDCVGNRGGSDGTMVRLRLFNCVKYFMEDMGWGERCWGPNAEGAEYRTLSWPKTSNKIISAATPLLRRIVTNERQRLYAIETRSSARVSDPKSKSGAKVRRGLEASKTPPDGTLTPDQDSEQPNPDIDPKLSQYHYSLGPTFASSSNAETDPHNGSENSDTSPQVDKAAVPSQPLSADDDNGQSLVKYNLNIVQDNRRIRTPLVLTPMSCPSFQSLAHYIHDLINDDRATPDRIQVLSPEGLRDIASEEAWVAVVNLVEECEWMEGDVKVVVSVIIPE